MYLKKDNLYKIKISPTPDNKYIVQKNIYYKIDKNIVKVPKGYKTNGADIPRIFWWFIPPFKPKYLPAVIFHDYLCDIEKYKLADDIFEDMLITIEDSFRTKIMIRAVRLYHRIKYKTPL